MKGENKTKIHSPFSLNSSILLPPSIWFISMGAMRYESSKEESCGYFDCMDDEVHNDVIKLSRGNWLFLEGKVNITVLYARVLLIVILLLVYI